MEAWLRALFGGLVLAGLVIGALVGLNNYGQELTPLLERYTGLDDLTVLLIVLMAFLVGFALSYRTIEETIESQVIRRTGVFSNPSAKVKPTLDHAEVEEIEFVQEAYIAYLQDRIQGLDRSKPVILKIKLYPPSPAEIPFLSRGGSLQRDILLYYLEKLKPFDNFKFVVFVDWFNRFLFFAKAKEFRDEIEPIEGTHIVDLMNGYRHQELSDLPIFNKHHISHHATNFRVLQAMARNEINEIMIVTHTWGRRYLGVAELNQLLGKMLAPKRDSRSLFRSLPGMHDSDDDDTTAAN